MTLTTLLAGVRVLDLSRLLPGPFCTRLLANLGAEVIKVETPLAGDYLRQAPPEFGFGAMFEVLNAGKRSVAINYRNPRGRALVHQLAQQADVVVESFRPGGADKYGLGYATLSALNPRLVYCALSGYGQSGPLRLRGGHDLNYIALAGLLAVDQPPTGLPDLPKAQMADLAGGMLGAVGVLAALHQQARTARGAFVDAALVDGALAWMLPLAATMQARTLPPGPGPLSGALPNYNVYACADGLTVTLAALEPNFWSDFCRVVNRPDWLSDPYNPALHAELTTLFASRPRAKWLTLFEAADVCLEPLLTPAEAQAHPHLAERLQVWGWHTATPAPAHGAGTHTVLTQWLNLPAAEVADLAAKGIVKLG